MEKLYTSDCILCGASGSTKKCSSCKTAYYCSRDCQMAHWKTHKEFCKKMAAKADAVLKGRKETRHKLRNEEGSL